MIAHRAWLALGILLWSVGMAGMIRESRNDQTNFTLFLLDLGLLVMGAIFIAAGISNKET